MRGQRGCRLLAFAVLVTGCASTRATGPIASGGGAPVVVRDMGADWDGPRSFRTRVRLSYDDGGGDVTLFLAWRSAASDHFELEAKDRLGRTWWLLRVEGQRATVLEPRAERVCTFVGAVELEALPLGPVTFAQIPRLLLGLLPTSPATAHWSDGRWAVVAVDGRRWSARSAEAPELPSDSGAAQRASTAVSSTGPLTFDTASELASWSLLGDDGTPLAWFERGGRVRRLSARHRSPGHPGRIEALQLRWRVGALMPWSGPLSPLEVPEGYSTEGCAGSSSG